MVLLGHLMDKQANTAPVEIPGSQYGLNARQTGANLVVGLLDFFLRGCTRDTEDLVEVLLAARGGTGVKGERAACMVRLQSYEVAEHSQKELVCFQNWERINKKKALNTTPVDFLFQDKWIKITTETLLISL